MASHINHTPHHASTVRTVKARKFNRQRERCPDGGLLSRDFQSAVNRGYRAFWMRRGVDVDSMKPASL